MLFILFKGYYFTPERPPPLRGTRRWVGGRRARSDFDSEKQGKRRGVKNRSCSRVYHMSLKPFIDRVH